MNPEACHSLLLDIVYHAVKDLETLNKHPDREYADDDHRAFCNAKEFSCGQDELTRFFGSAWFHRICDEFQDINAETIIANISL